MKFLIVYGSCGHGHKKAAEYVAEELKARGEEDIVLMDFLDYSTPFFKRVYPSAYKIAVTKIPFLWKIGFDISNLKMLNFFVTRFRRFSNSFHVRAFEKFITENNPQNIILTHFLPAEVCAALKFSGKISSKVYTIITDSIAHATWINYGVDYFIGFSEDTKKGLKDWGIDDEKIKILGIPISKKFVKNDKKRVYLQKYGLEDGKLTILFTSGSFGIGPTEKFIDSLERFGDNIQLIIVCGNNKKLYNRLHKKEVKVKIKVFPFIDFMDELMEMSDIVVAKTGGLTMCESLSKELPMCISKPIPGQETYNADFLLANKCAFKINCPNDLIKTIEDILADKNILKEKIENIRKVAKPNATSDIVDLVLSESP